MALTKIEISRLLAEYGDLLTDRQKDVLTMYCDCDCSLGEIADEIGISRQGVRDAILKGETTLTKMENALALSQLKKDLAVAIARQDKDKVFEVAKHFVSKE